MPSIFESIIRADDFLHCQFEFVNLVLLTSSTGVQRLERAAAGPAFIVVRLPPQNMAEQVVSEGSSPNLPYRAGLAGPSRLACLLPDNVTHVDYRLDALLEKIGSAELKPADNITATDPITAIEFPDRLLLVPQLSARLLHRAKPFTSPKTNVTEIWHTTLRDGPDNIPPRFKVIQNPNDNDTAAPRPGPLSKLNRKNILDHSRRSADPHVVASSLFRLTALGATARLKGNWVPHQDIALAAWEHQAELGRDHYVYTLEQGFLCPFGHRASIATVTERKFASHGGVQTAELAETKLLTVLDEDRSYSELKHLFPGQGREMPFVRVRIASAPRSISDNDAPIRVDLVMEDRANNRIDCSATVFFVPVGPAATTDGPLRALRRRYAEELSAVSPTGQPVTMSFVSLGGQRVAMTPGGAVGDTSLNVESLTFNVKLPSELLGPAVPAFLPFMAKAEAKIPGLEHMVGTAAGATPAAQRKATSIEFHKKYLDKGFLPGDRKEVFATFSPIPGISIPAERAGGLAAPTFPAIDGLSRLTGPVANVQGFVNGDMLTADKLIGSTKLLGVISLRDIIENVTADRDQFPVDNVSDLFNKVDAPGSTIFLPRPVMTTVAGPSGVETRFVWKPRIKIANPADLLQGLLPGQPPELVLKGHITKGVRSASSPPTFTVIGALRNFKLSFKMLEVQFSALEFISEAGRKADVKLHVAGINFRGDLSFVQTLQKALSFGSLARGPSIQTLPDGVVVRYAIPLPSIPLGALSIQNVALSTSVSLSFVEGKPAAARFALSERNNPFQITVSIFGGTGFFAVEVFTSGSVRVEAALEFGGIAALNLVIVKGGVYLLAGIYLSMKSDGDVLIEGHLRLGGFVDVLGLISVSIEVFIALTYIPTRNVLYGTGRLTVGIKLLFFSESFSFEIEKEIPGFGAAPSQTMMMVTAAAPLGVAPLAMARAPEMTARQWETYCSAFV